MKYLSAPSDNLTAARGAVPTAHKFINYIQFLFKHTDRLYYDSFVSFANLNGCTACDVTRSQPCTDYKRIDSD